MWKSLFDSDRAGWQGWLSAAVVLAGVWVCPVFGQLSNPIPQSISKQGLRVEIRDLVQFPNTKSLPRPDEQGRSSSSRARINFFRELELSSGNRRFVNDLRGFIYELDDTNQISHYFDFHDEFPNTSNLIYGEGLATGFVCYEFHPRFECNGKLYTIHAERGPGNPRGVGTPERNPDFMPPGYAASTATYHTVITEWTVSDPTATSLTSSNTTRRELLRVGHVTNKYFHPFGDLQFRPTALPGDADYGLLYISGGDWAFINGGSPGAPDAGQLQRLDSLAGTMLRIDPRSPSETMGQAGLGDYTIPADNPFVDGSASTLDEIYAYGFRNGHRMAWDDMGRLFVSGIGQAHIEEVNRILAGGNYGWADREGTFVNGLDTDDGGNGNSEHVFALTSGADADDDFLYPVIQYDHGEGNAIAGGFVYAGDTIPALAGKFVFGDVVRGRIFAADVADMQTIDIADPSTTASIEEIQLFTTDTQGNETDVDLRSDLLGGSVPDLRFGLAADGEIYLTTKADGRLRILGPEPTPVDLDSDGVDDAVDNCPQTANAGQSDADSDGIGDVCDACVATIPCIPVDGSGCPPVVPGDLDRDGDVDGADVTALVDCNTGPAIPQNDPLCADAKLDADDDVDSDDFGITQRCLSGQDVAGDPGCASMN